MTKKFFKVMLSWCTNLFLWAGKRSRNNTSTEERSLLITKWRGQTFLFKANRPLWLWMDYRMDWKAKRRLIRFLLSCYCDSSLALILLVHAFLPYAQRSSGKRCLNLVARQLGNKTWMLVINRSNILARCVLYTIIIHRLLSWTLRDLFHFKGI